MTYIHFRTGNNFYNPESNMAESIYPITKNTQFLNLKNEKQFQNFIKKGLNEENINNESEFYSWCNVNIKSNNELRTNLFINNTIINFLILK